MKQWVINSLLCKPKEDNLNDVIISINWVRVCNETINQKDYISQISGNYTCSEPNPNDFTPYDQITYNQVCSWLDEGLPVEEIDLNLDLEIEKQINPPIVMPPLPFTNP